ncbi:CPBP family intramembrane glutamic endopeptidase [Leptolyngbya sp. CCNP1308]|uniref:CPBP family intramembrane glutamic endopeptidase n=1 Tax=Leptolyngbya sp. CCNP1308 TaxID=3110255 RepID=UPI002B213D4A|nr:CPBP family intramembrane glutamic endopeptidase [Leptolyngbya sp. CCNP1308]MEA5452603.1 CPBP family intramembrane glutamic endopeptidase [Leptolyngbya sp. CCNP1308]
MIQLHKLVRYPAPVRIFCFLLLLALIWVPIALPLYAWLGTDGSLSVIPLVLLYVLFMVWLVPWGRRVHRQAQPLRTHGLGASARHGRELVIGVVVGLVSLALLFTLEGGLVWLTWQPAPPNLGRIVLEGLLLGLGVGLAEELLFRGWLLDELRYDWGFTPALWASGTIYGALHFIKPWEAIVKELPSFPGLLLLGLTLGWARQRTAGRLGLAIGLHGGLVAGYYLIDVGDLAIYTERVPEWVTGLNQNPLAGAMGVLFLALISAGIRYVPGTSPWRDVS